jgi:Ca2+-transporting ATPase
MTSNSDAAPVSIEQGLSADQAREILTRDGPNELPQEHQRNVLRIVLDALREPMLQLLLAAGVLYLFIGDLAEALILMGFAMGSVALVVVQESKTERALAALKTLSSPGALVIRDGARRSIPGAEVVVGDIIVLTEGDRVPADARLIEVSDLQIDESLLTGESVPVRKKISTTEHSDPRPGGDDSPHVWSGSLIVRGTGLARVMATGANTQIGRIGKSLETVKSAPTPLQIQTGRLVRIFAIIAIASSVLLAVVYGFLHGAWIKGILAGITLAMAILPEEFPLVLTVFLVLGAWRMSQNKVLTRRSAAIEALGAVTVLCTDKTGTLTLNRMSVATLVTDNGLVAVPPPDGPELPEPFHALAEFAILASRPDPFDTMERAFVDCGDRTLKGSAHLHPDWTLAHSYPLTPDFLAMSQVWQTKDGAGYVVATKGAPETVVDLCHLPSEQTASVRRSIASLAAQGLRVLAVAQADWAGPGWPVSQHDFAFRFLGLMGLADPLRPEVPAAVVACETSGIRVVMITGDHPTTALAIANQAGIPADNALSGMDIAALDDGAFAAAIARTNVFARIMPEQKLRLVQAFAASGEVVAMTGDGVNDAPSLKAAHIGVAMGGRGTDVAREAASLVLLDDNFASLVTAVRLGRRIDDNLRKAIGYILAVHVPIAGMSLLPALLGWPLVLGPIHVVFLELIIDPVSSIVFEAEPEEKGIMSRPPRKPNAPLFDRGLLLHGLWQGGVVMAATLGVFLIGMRDVHGEDVSRAMAFVTLVLGNLGLVLTNRSLTSSAASVLTRPNRALVLVVVTTLAALSLSLFVPWLRNLFGFAPLSLAHLGEAAGAALACVVVNDVVGVLWRQWRARTPTKPAASA